MAGDDGVRCPHDDVAPPHRQEVRAGRTLARLAQCVWGSGGGGVALYTSMVAGLYGRWQSESVLNHKQLLCCCCLSPSTKIHFCPSLNLAYCRDQPTLPTSGRVLQRTAL